MKVAVAALIFEVGRNARSEARKEEARKQEVEVVSQHITLPSCHYIPTATVFNV